MSGVPPVRVVGTPIGNLGDLSPRALEALRDATIIACEDTRRTGTLLSAHGIHTRMVAVHAHNEASQTARLLESVRNGARLAVVSDAGMPGVSDPGARLVSAAHDAGIAVEVVPGPSALTAAIAATGVPGEAVTFVGFFPRRAADRDELLDRLDAAGVAIVGFESPQRIAERLIHLQKRDPTRRGGVCRELTKLHEEVVVGTMDELVRAFPDAPRGEITLVLWPARPAADDAGAALERVVAVLLDAGLSPKAAARAAADLGAGARNAAYAAATARNRDRR
ncbi:MAG: 16S rRNA (cytidine(1402)-2'-O)-methyltransferase [Thermoleophilia bacterium]|nr:16S rRNA (cytidine(1402)-2'-O)-methyltransferase [Thermoleophilia bacterium]